LLLLRDTLILVDTLHNDTALLEVLVESEVYIDAFGAGNFSI